MNLRRIGFSVFHNYDYLQCSTEFIDLIEEFEPAKLKIEDLFRNEYCPAFNTFDRAMQELIKNSFTEAKNEAYRRCDYTFRGMMDINKIALNHSKENIVQAAKRLKILFDTYINITHKSQQEQTSATSNLLQELKENYKAETGITGLAIWAAQLKADNNAYKALMKSSDAEYAAKIEEKVKDARYELDKIYTKIILHIEALSLIEGAEIHNDFIRRWDTVLEKYNNTVAQRQGISGNKKDNEDSLDGEYGNEW